MRVLIGAPVTLVQCDIETAEVDKAALDEFCKSHGFIGWYTSFSQCVLFAAQLVMFLGWGGSTSV